MSDNELSRLHIIRGVCERRLRCSDDANIYLTKPNHQDEHSHRLWKKTPPLPKVPSIPAIRKVSTNFILSRFNLPAAQMTTEKQRLNVFH
ncbi:hypothetical protein [Vibrio sp. HA2012]|uniref:hypothetical protein n=1 Tax=Vibrio sp. HA2012 TaxID=1971595 RepID=UPI0012FDB275|nr:hypothetical protein [Vibrio sp. HA2012]